MVRLAFLTVGFGLFFVGGLVYAVEKQVDQSIYEIGKFHIDTFSSYLSDSEFSLGKMLFGANGTDFLKMMTNMFFSLSKLIWQGLDFVIEKLYEGAAMNELIHQFFTFFGYYLFENIRSYWCGDCRLVCVISIYSSYI